MTEFLPMERKATSVDVVSEEVEKGRNPMVWDDDPKEDGGHH